MNLDYLEEIEPTNIIDSHIYLVDSNNKIRLLTYESVHGYISDICHQIKKEHLDVKKITDKVYPKLKTKNTVSELEDQIVMCATEMVTDHYDYPYIATWVLIHHLHQNTSDDYLQTVEQLYANVNKKGKPAPIVSIEFYHFVKEHYREINSALKYDRDYDFTVFGYRTLEKAYLKRLINGQIVERPQHMFMRVAIALHFRTNRLDRIFESYELLSMGYFTHATPTLFNAGTTHEQLSSCFLLGIADDMECIGECWRDSAVLSKYSGGIGINVTNIRSNGAYINSTQGTASGLRLLTVFNQIARYADQGGRRAGSIAIYIEPWHADVYFFLDLKKPTGSETERARDLFLGLMINDIFMERIEADGIWSLMCPSECPDLLDKYGKEFSRIYESYEAAGRFIKQIRARDLWFRIMESQIESGVPYIVFKDAVNYKSNQINIGVVNGSNLCVSGDTNILTSKGYRGIRNLENQTVEVWNGEEFSEVTVKKTGVNQKMLRINFSNGTGLKCTPYHNFYLADGSKNQRMIKIEASKLKVGDRLIKCKYPIIKEGLENFKYPYTHGLFCADGSYANREHKNNKEIKQCSHPQINGSKFCGRHIKHSQKINKELIEDPLKCQALINLKIPMIVLYGKKIELFPYLDVIDCCNLDFKHDDLVVRLYYDIAEKFKVPLNCTLDIKLKWLAGLLDGDGCVCMTGTSHSLQIFSNNRKFLVRVKYMLQTMGCDPKISIDKRTESLLPDGKGGHKLYNIKPVYKLLIHSIDTYNLIESGLKPRRLNLEHMAKPQRAAAQFTRVTKITKLDEKEHTYCFTEPKRGMGIFNGIIAGNCAEIIEVTSDKLTAVCNLCSIGLPKFVTPINEKVSFDYQKLFQITRVIARNLDNIIDINFYPIEKARISNITTRPIGIGVQGLADVFAILKTPFDSELARDLNKKIFETIYFGALTESLAIAKEKGPYDAFHGSPLSKGQFQFDLWGLDRSQLMWDWDTLQAEIQIYGVRNSLVTACMPTASTSQILGNNETMEPYTENIYTRSTLAGDFYVINTHLMKDLMELGLWNSDMVDLIKYYDGSIASIPTIPDNIKQIYRTVWEIPQKSIIEMAADRGPFVDQTQSMNIFISKANFAKLNSCLFYGWKKGLKTGMYYLRSKAASEANQFGIDIHKIKELEAKYNKTEPVCKYVPKHLRKPGDCDVCSA